MWSEGPESKLREPVMAFILQLRSLHCQQLFSIQVESSQMDISYKTIPNKSRQYNIMKKLFELTCVEIEFKYITKFNATALSGGTKVAFAVFFWSPVQLGGQLRPELYNTGQHTGLIIHGGGVVMDKQERFNYGWKFLVTGLLKIGPSSWKFQSELTKSWCPSARKSEVLIRSCGSSLHSDMTGTLAWMYWICAYSC